MFDRSLACLLVACILDSHGPWAPWVIACAVRVRSYQDRQRQSFIGTNRFAHPLYRVLNGVRWGRDNSLSVLDYSIGKSPPDCDRAPSPHHRRTEHHRHNAHHRRICYISLFSALFVLWRYRARQCDQQKTNRDNSNPCSAQVIYVTKAILLL